MPVEIDLTDEDAYDALLQIPPEYTGSLPKDSLPVMELLQHPLPSKSRSLVMVDPVGLFSGISPNADMSLVTRTHPIPPLEWTSKAREELKRLAKAGTRVASLSDPYGSWNTHLSTWILQYWDLSRAIVDNRDGWKAAMDWVRSKSGTSVQCTEAAQDLEKELSRVGWGDQIEDLPIRYLQRYLGDQLSGWLSSDGADLATDYINKVLRQRNDLPQNVIVARTIFYDCIKQDAKSWAQRSELQDHMVLVRKGYTRTFFLVNVNENHWITFLIDFGKRNIKYGEYYWSKDVKPIKRNSRRLAVGQAGVENAEPTRQQDPSMVEISLRER
jgi:hypothetical protein